MTAKTSPKAHPDAGLLVLADEFRRLWDAECAFVKSMTPDQDVPEEEAILTSMVDACHAVADRILAFEPKTVDGLRVFAMCWAWCHQSATDDQPTFHENSPYVDVRAAEAVLKFLTRAA